MFSSFLNIFYSPLEQFDNVNWVLAENILESFNTYSFYVFSNEYNLFLNALNLSVTENNMKGTLISLVSFFLISKVVLSYLTLNNEILFRTTSYIFLIIFIHLITGTTVFVWFDDLVTVNFVHSTEEFVKSPFSLKETHEVLELDYLLTFIPQINMGLYLDENMISFITTFFLFNGSEEEDMDYILDDEESDLVEDIVAPLFVSNLGTNVEDNGSLFVKVSSVFAFVLSNNLMGMVPYSDTATSSLILTFWTGLSVFGALIYLMIQKQGVNHLFSLFLPAGSPLSLMFVIIPLEFISYVFRVVSLSVRLFANMMAGHTLIKVILGFSWSMILLGDIFLVINIFPIAILFILTFLEIGVAIVQAYIFTTLICMYLKDIYVGH